MTTTILESALPAVLIIVGVLYAAASAFLWFGGLKRSDRVIRGADAPFVTVIVPARNERDNLGPLVGALSSQRFPPDRWEVWIVDDRSDDGTGDLAEELVGEMPCAAHVVRQRDVPEGWSPKKHAITSTIRASADGRSPEDLILTTDADCRPEPGWIASMVATLGDADLVAGYSPYGHRTNPFFRVLALEAFSQAFLALAGIRLRWPITCTGRSFAYRRGVFEEAGGFGAASTMLSGDDHLFLQRAVGAGFRAVYNVERDSFVWTDPPGSFREFRHQRIRMFSGVGKITPSVAVVGTATYVWMLALFAGMLALQPAAWMAFGVKFVLDGVSLLLAARHFGEWKLLRVYPLASVLYLPYFLTFALFGTFGSYDWKGMRGR